MFADKTAIVFIHRNVVLYSRALEIVTIIPAGNYLFKVNHRNTRTRCEICSKLKIKTPETKVTRSKRITQILHLDWVPKCFIVPQRTLLIISTCRVSP